MSSKSISLILKQGRNAKNLTPDEVVSMLNERGFSISTKTLYAYEAGTNLPKVPVFIALCEIYEIRDIVGSFGHATVPLCTNEIRFLKLYRQLDDRNRDVAFAVLEGLLTTQPERTLILLPRKPR